PICTSRLIVRADVAELSDWNFSAVMVWGPAVMSPTMYCMRRPAAAAPNGWVASTDWLPAFTPSGAPGGEVNCAASGRERNRGELRKSRMRVRTSEVEVAAADEPGGEGNHDAWPAGAGKPVRSERPGRIGAPGKAAWMHSTAGIGTWPSVRAGPRQPLPRGSNRACPWGRGMAASERSEPAPARPRRRVPCAYGAFTKRIA